MIIYDLIRIKIKGVGKIKKLFLCTRNHTPKEEMKQKNQK